jgi:hypothetical protein
MESFRRRAFVDKVKGFGKVDAKASALPPSAWVVSPSEKQNWFLLNVLRAKIMIREERPNG